MLIAGQQIAKFNCVIGNIETSWYAVCLYTYFNLHRLRPKPCLNEIMNKKKKEYNGVKEIARRANVSIATVDRVIHNRPGVSAKTKEKIDGIIKELNYQPNILASRLASRKIFNFAVLIPEVSAETDFWRSPLNGIKRAEAAISEYGIDVSFYFFDLNDRKSFERQSHLILKQNPDGILLAPSFINEAIEFTGLCNDRGIPFVLIDSNLPNKEGLCYIGPNLFRSGYLCAQLTKFNLSHEAKILLVNISRELDDDNNLPQIEEGFRAYFKYHNLQNDIIKTEITLTGYSDVEKELQKIFNKDEGIKAVFVTNSRVFTVARYFETARIKDIFLIGYDFLEQNIEYLKKGIIDILICHRPGEQGYQGLMKLYQHFVMGTAFKNVFYMPIDIITKENYEFYDNYIDSQQ